MKKKILLASVAAMLVLCFACSGALAATEAQIRQLRTKVEVANAQIQVYVLWAMITPYDDVDWLLERVDSVVNPVFAYARSIGVAVVCEYDYYFIDGRIVAIDPLRVVNVGSGTGGNS